MSVESDAAPAGAPAPAETPTVDRASIGPSTRSPRGERSAGLQARVGAARGDFALDVSCRVAPGEVVAVLGPNGSGKSTLLDVLAGLAPAAEGSVVLGDRVLVDVERRVAVAPHERRVGLLGQQPLLFGHLSARGNVAFGPRCAGRDRRAAAAVADRWLDEVGVAELAERRPGELSGGQAQRVAIARALATEPELLLLDEPFAALDVTAAPAIRATLRRVIGEVGQTTLMVTHDVIDAMTLADRVLVLAGGRVVEWGPTAEVLARPRSAFAARIAGLNRVVGIADPDGLRTRDGTVLTAARGEAVSPGSDAVALFAPTAVTVHAELPTRPGRTPPDALVVPARVGVLEPHGELVRLRFTGGEGVPDWVDGLAADLAPGTVADLAAETGRKLWLQVAAGQVSMQPAYE